MQCCMDKQLNLSLTSIAHYGEAIGDDEVTVTGVREACKCGCAVPCIERCLSRQVAI